MGAACKKQGIDNPQPIGFARQLENGHWAFIGFYEGRNPDLNWLQVIPARQNDVMPQTPAERQEARRKRLLMEGLTEVRGIFLPPAQHAALKAQATKMLKRAKPAPPKDPQ